MFRRPVQAALCAVLAVLLAAPAAHALDISTLRKKLAAESRRLSTTSGAYVRDLVTGRTLYSRKPDARRAPASNEKLLTTSTALLRFGSAAEFRTTLEATEAPRDGVVHGDVALVGAGDPYLSASQMRLIASQLSALGVTEITGKVLGDGTIFDSRLGSYDSGYRYDSDIGGSLGGLVVDEARTSDPALHAANALRQTLLDADIRVDKGAHSGTLGSSGTPIASVSSAPLSTEITRINVPSDNFAAEMLVKALGADFGSRGSTPAGAAVVRSTLRPLGLSPHVVDGSGLSRSDQVSPREIVTLLTAMASQSVGAALRASLPTAGRTGTLADRMRHTAAQDHCHAKTGTLTGVSALSGYCATQGG
ncbi:MAG: hypothetical protein JWM71_1216, partial [Solirubrobacteraceae bacterium]|nr:hypothetical protein [Solirubrobacteraceae bacterium]